MPWRLPIAPSRRSASTLNRARAAWWRAVYAAIGNRFTLSCAGVVLDAIAALRGPAASAHLLGVIEQRFAQAAAPPGLAAAITAIAGGRLASRPVLVLSEQAVIANTLADIAQRTAELRRYL